MLLAFAALLLLFLLTGFLTNAYRSERRARGVAHFRKGETLAREGRQSEAVEEYRAALLYGSNDTRYRQALADSLLDLGRLDEAEAHLLELRQTDPNNALINLMLARIAARQRRIEPAVTYYHRAIYGLWPENPVEHRIEARFELVDLLARSGQRKQILAELLELAGDAPDEPGTMDKIGTLLLTYGSPSHASEVFQGVLDGSPRDAQAAYGLGEAQFAQANYGAALSAFRKAAHLDPDNQQARQRLEETARLLASDPTLVSLSARERFQRSRALLSATVASLESCGMQEGAAPPDSQALIEEARQLLQLRKQGNGQTPQILQMAERVWSLRKKVCGAPPKSEEAINLILAKAAK